MRKLVLFALLFITFCKEPVRDDSLRVVFIDVGHGDCILIQTPDDKNPANGIYQGLNILIDGGEREAGEKIVVPFLKSKRIDTIDVMIATHNHSDHLAGLIPVLEAFPVKMVLEPGYERRVKFYKDFISAVKNEPGCKYYKRLVPDLLEKEGDELDWGKELKVVVLNSEHKVNEQTINNSSIVLKISYGETSVLLMADAEGKKRKEPPETVKYLEKDLIEEFGDGLKSDILKVGHHGSETSTTIPFLEKVKPGYAIILAGRKSFSGKILPDESVVERLEEREIKIFRTDFLDSKPTPGDDHIEIIISKDKGIKRIRYLPLLII